MYCCRRFCRNAWWLRRQFQTTSPLNGPLSTNSLLEIVGRKYLVNKTGFDGISRHFGTSFQFNAKQKSDKKTATDLKEGKSEAEKKQQEAIHQRILKKLQGSKFRDLVDEKMKDPNYFQSFLDKIKLLGLLQCHAVTNLELFTLSEKTLDDYFKKLEVFKAAGFSSQLYPSVFKPLQKNGPLPDLDNTLQIIEELQTKYGMSQESVQELTADDIQQLLRKVKVVNSAGFPKPFNYSHYGFLLKFPESIFLEIYSDLQKSGLKEYRVTDIQKLLAEKNYGIQNIELLSKFTGVSVAEIQMLTKHYNHQYIQIPKNDLEEKISVMKSYGLTSEEICGLCSYLAVSSNSLTFILQKYTDLKKEKIVPWELSTYLQNPCVQNLKGHRTLNLFGENMIAFQTKIGYKEEFCQQTLISVLALSPKKFEAMLSKIEVLNKVLPLEKIITPEGFNFLINLGLEAVVQGVKRSESLQEPTIEHIVNSFFYKTMNYTKVEQRKTICKLLNCSYMEVRRFIKGTPIKLTNLQENLTLLENFGFAINDIRKLFIVVLLADTNELKHQLDILSSRPEIQASNVQVTSFRALNYVQYFLECESKDDKYLDPVSVSDENNEEDENESDFLPHEHNLKIG